MLIRTASGCTPRRFRSGGDGWTTIMKVTIDNDCSMLWVVPRNPKSGWARPNKERIARLEREGRLRPAGRLAVQVAKANDAWSLLDNIDNIVVPADLADAFERHPGAREHWDAFPPSARKMILGWITQARTAATRAKRVAEAAERAAVGERANQRPRR